MKNRHLLFPPFSSFGLSGNRINKKNILMPYWPTDRLPKLDSTQTDGKIISKFARLTKLICYCKTYLLAGASEIIFLTLFQVWPNGDLLGWFYAVLSSDLTDAFYHPSGDFLASTRKTNIITANNNIYAAFSCGNYRGIVNKILILLTQSNGKVFRLCNKIKISWIKCL